MLPFQNEVSGAEKIACALHFDGETSTAIDEIRNGHRETGAHLDPKDARMGIRSVRGGGTPFRGRGIAAQTHADLRDGGRHAFEIEPGEAEENVVRRLDWIAARPLDLVAKGRTCGAAARHLLAVRSAGVLEA